MILLLPKCIFAVYFFDGKFVVKQASELVV
ncbi:hypothetical protein D934_00250 [Xylella fastidiosa subsp. sandyi Ann-1]|uniref:Uncharacterized protein n=1 Tax=Xylella fastidiosa subsp. sandyi Ann-1 TaxID=155920 RepID=A0A060H5R5_XYLFS|nr:hypothetical protein D934_00250 [Xylella fastidiosa subsp. sandyi Ann-1]AIC14163.1 hypothetical protein P303_12470 [Xylella fastidiosa MUL0034]KAF0571401.1 hypothetical protein P305_04695 [Xylella fastidiosa subsp. fastidiosa Mus-1]